MKGLCFGFVLLAAAWGASAQSRLSVEKSVWESTGAGIENRWVYVPRSREWVDMATARRDGNVVTVWTRTFDVDAFKNINSNAHSLHSRVAYNCESKSSSVRTMTLRDANGRVLHSTPKNEHADWDEQIPDSVGEGVLLFVCG